MDAALKAKWVEALRSGKYEQGRGRLRSLDWQRFCCLGVLCEVDGGSYGDAFGVLPETLAERAKIPLLQQNTLIGLNDTARATFAQIADYIEGNL